MAGIVGSTRHIWIAETLGYDSYAQILADTAATLHTPVNIGIFAGWGSGKTYLLRKIKEILLSAKFNTTQNSPLLSIWLLISLLFFRPPRAIKNKNETRYIAVSFNALEYAGSDHLWAGLVTKIVDAVELGFGKLASAIFRANPYNVLEEKNRHEDEQENDKEKVEDPTKFHAVKLWGFPWWVLFIISTSIVIGLGVALLVYAYSTKATLEAEAIEEEEEPATTFNQTTSIPLNQASLFTQSQKANASLGVGGIILMIPFIRSIKMAVPVVIKTINSQSAKIRRLVSRQDLSQVLGVMAKVKYEIYHITELVRYMELFEGRQIIIAIFIDDLDKLPQQTIAPLLQAINILLTGPNSRFVSFIAMDPEAVTAALEMGIQSQFPAINISGHRYLNRLIQVPFSIPVMNTPEKKELLTSLIRKTETVVTKQGVRRISRKPETTVTIEDTTDGEADGLIANEENIPLVVLDKMESNNSSFKKKKLTSFTDVAAATESILLQYQSEEIFPFINTNLQEMTRLVGITKVTARIIFCRREVIPINITCFQVAVWIVLVAHWPYRLTWMIEFVEDLPTTRENDNKTLKEIYDLIDDKLTLPVQWKKLMKLDESPDILVRFLSLHGSWLNVEMLRFFLPNTISLDRSLKDIVATTSIERQARLNLLANFKSLITMTNNDVVKLLTSTCESSKQLERYKDRCKRHNITGLTLLKCDMTELQNTLKLTLGDWIGFSRKVFQLREAYERTMGLQSEYDVSEQLRLTR